MCSGCDVFIVCSGCDVFVMCSRYGVFIAQGVMFPCVQCVMFSLCVQDVAFPREFFCVQVVVFPFVFRVGCFHLTYVDSVTFARDDVCW